MSTKHTIARDHDAPLFGFHWCAGIGEPAGPYWLDGRCILAGLGTRAEAYLVDLGAIAVGTLRFGPDPLEGHARIDAVLPLPAGELAVVAEASNS